MFRSLTLLLLALALVSPHRSEAASGAAIANDGGLGHGLIVMEIDGLSEPRLRAALEEGRMPFLAGLLSMGSHRLGQWETIGASTTPVAQAGILHGSTQDIPGYRWWDRGLGRLVEANRPDDAFRIERSVSGPSDLLADGGASIGNFLSGGADHKVATVSNMGGLGLALDAGGYVLNPLKATAVLIGLIDSLGREAAHARAGQAVAIDPAAKRKAPVPIFGPALESVLIDVIGVAVVEEVLRGTPIMYASLATYDEVAHYAGPDHVVASDMLTRIDATLRMIGAAAEVAGRPYHLVILSDHGQTDGEAFESRYGETLEDLIRGLMSGGDAETQSDDRADLVIAASGNLAHVYFAESDHRLGTAEIDRAHPGLLSGLAAHPGIGIVMTLSEGDELVAAGPDGRNEVARSNVEGGDPLEPYGRYAAESLLQIGSSTDAGDIVIVSTYDPVADEVYSFEPQIGSHGGLGGAQTKAILVYPTELEPDIGPLQLVGAEAVHDKIREWMDSAE